MNELPRVVELEQLSCPQELWQRLLEDFANLGFDYVIYLSTNEDMSQTQVLTNIPEIYSHTDPSEDPFLHYCCKSYDVTFTGPEFVEGHDYLPLDARQFIHRASQTGFISGVGVPTRVEGSARFGGFNLGTGLTRGAFEAEVVPRLDQLRLFCVLAHRCIESVYPDVSPQMSRLSPRERDVISLISQGVSRKECARRLGLSPNTVADYTKSVYRKLGARNRAEAARLLRSNRNI